MENVVEETSRLRGTIRDLVALTTLPADWINLGPDGIACSLADVLLHTLSLDLVYIRLSDPPMEVYRCGPSFPSDLEAVRVLLSPVIEADCSEPRTTIRYPGGGEELKVAVTRFGMGDEHGVLVTASRGANFPTERDRVLLGVGANQTALVVQQRRAKEQLHEREEWLSVTLRSIGDAVVATDTEGRVTFLNPVAQQLTGWTPPEAQGQPLRTVFRIINEQTRQPVPSPVDKVLAEGKIVGLANHTLLIAKDGTERPIDDSAAPIEDSAGAVIGAVLIFRDVTEQRRAARSVQESNARNSAILETALDCIITMDHQGKVVDFNPAAEATFGYPRADAIGVELAELIIPEEQREAHRKGLARYLATGQGPIIGKRIELVARHSDGHHFPVELTVTRIASDGGPLFTAYLRDISARLRNETHRDIRLAVTQVLTQATSISGAVTGLLRAVCEGLGWAVGYFWKQEPGTNELHCRDSWHAPGVDVPLFDHACRQRTFGIGEGLPGVAWETGEPVWLLDVVESDNFPRAASAATEGLHGAFACPIGVDGHVAGVMEFFSPRIEEPDRDLLETVATSTGLLGQFIERKQAEEALRRSEARFRGLMEQAPFSIQVFAPDGRTLRVNRAWEELWGLAFDQLSDYNVLEDPQLADKGILPYLKQGFAGQMTRIPAIEYDVEQTLPNLTRHEDPRRWISAVIYPLKDSDGQVREVVLVHEDVTARKLAEDELQVRVKQLAEAGVLKEMLVASLRDTDRRKDEFLATLAHELRNPLAPIRNSLQILKIPHVDAARARATTELMERQVHHLVRLVDDLLDVSRVMRGKIELRKEPVELADVVVRAVETAQPLIDLQEHELEISLPEHPLLLDADPVRLSQVVANLLMNAAKYTDPGGHISLSAVREGEEAVLSVRDDGIGIAPDMLPFVFDLFVQVDHATTRSEGGLGLGLTLVRNLVALHGGSVELHSDGLGQGCEFVVRLPLSSSEQLTSEGSEQPHGITEPSGIRLLVVDDNEDAATTLGMLLEYQGHEVRVVYDGESALEAANDFHPDLILLDIGMPGMDGYEVARRIRATPSLNNTVLAALTGWGQLEDRRRTAAAGFDHHLVKPLEPEALAAILDEIERSRTAH